MSHFGCRENGDGPEAEEKGPNVAEVSLNVAETRHRQHARCWSKVVGVDVAASIKEAV